MLIFIIRMKRTFRKVCKRLMITLGFAVCLIYSVQFISTVEEQANIVADFKPLLNDSQLESMKKALHVLTEAMKQASVDYHMCGGTLIGSYLHHGLIPWDDDIDLCVVETDKARLLQALDSTAPHYDYVIPPEHTNNKRIKFFSVNQSHPFNQADITWRSPFIDICLYGEDGSTIWDLSMGWRFWNAKRFPKSVVFPLARRPFMNMTLSAPRLTREYLTQNYDLEACMTNAWSHLNERWSEKSQRKAPCQWLWPLYSFVFRTRLPNGIVQETLKRGNITLGSVVVDEFDSLLR